MERRFLFAFLFIYFCSWIQCTTALQCEEDDTHCHLASKQSAVIARYQEELSKYHSILADTNCSICNLNGINPCLNGGTCTVLDKYTYVCSCPEDYGGKYCQNHITCGPHDCGVNANCTVFNHNKVCSCPMGYTGDPRFSCNVKNARACIRGDPHYSTFDGSYYTYMGTCPYKIMETTDKKFNIVGYNEFRRGSTQISYLTSFDLFTKNTTFKISNDLKLYVNGIRHFFPYYYPSMYNPIVKVTKSCGHVKIHDYATGALLDYRDYQLCVTVPQTQVFYGTGKTGGALGDIDNDCSNDYKLSNGTILNINGNCNQGASVNAAIFVDSWVTDPNYQNCVMGKIIQNNTDCNTQDAQNQCDYIRQAINSQGPFKKCQPMSQSVIQQYFEDCVYDVCQGYTRCDVLANFATSCLEQIPFVEIDTWRDSTNCPWACPAFSDYSLKTPVCQDTCADPNFSNSSLCNDGIQEGCKCWPGYYLDSVGDNGFPFACRRLGDCGCTDSYGNYYPPNTKWMNDDCSTYYQCINGTFTSQPVVCSVNAQCGLVDGDPTCICKDGYTGDGYSCRQCPAPMGGFNCTQYMPKRHCADWYVYNYARSNGVYNISIGADYSSNPGVRTEVYCDMESDGGGWTLASHSNFTAAKTYEQYVNGFGDALNQQVWLGLENLHVLTDQMPTSLRVVIERCMVNNVPNTTTECTYPTFSVLASNLGYPVFIPEYCANGNETIFDGFDGWVRWPRNETGPIFTTFDKDSTPYNCSAEYKGTGWWFYARDQGSLCGAANLNGLRQTCNNNYLPEGYVTWHHDPVEDARMFLRPKNYPNYDNSP